MSRTIVPDWYDHQVDTKAGRSTMTETFDRRSFLKTGVMGATALAGSGLLGAQTTPRKPNFVFILIDDLGWADVGCYGSELYETPNIDRLAAEGMRFTDAYAAAPVCSPTRAALMSGRYPARVKVTGIVPGQTEGLLAEEITVAERLKEAGYVSAAVGKWHLGHEHLYPEKQGFDINIGGSHIGMVSGFFHPKWNEARGRGRARGGVGVEGEPGDYLPDRLSQKACEFIRNHQNDPFFLYLAHYTVHTPMEAKEPMVEKYRRKVRTDAGQNNPIYAAMVESMDESVGRVLDTLDELGLAEDTVVIFTSDNGGLSVYDDENTPATSNAPLRAGKGYLYEGGIRVPLIVRRPGIVEAGSTSGAPVTSTDYLPTMVEIAGLQPSPGVTLDGVSLVPALEQTGELDREAIFWHYPHHDIDGAEPGSIIRQGDYKLIEFFDDPRVELYNLADDISETTDLASKMPEKARAMARMLADWRASVGAEVPAPRPPKA